jgi:ABC-type Na+ transport system ATPase subunit NatA
MVMYDTAVVSDVGATVTGTGERFCVFGVDAHVTTRLLEVIAGLYVPCSGVVMINGVHASSVRRVEQRGSCSLCHLH